MPTYQLTVDSEQLQSLFTSGDLAGVLQDLLNQVLQAQATEQLGAEPYVRSDERQGVRNGTKPRTLITRAGRLQLALPQFRGTPFTTELFQRYQRTEQALLVTLMEMVINGVSTRKVAAITEELCGHAFSKSLVSALCQTFDPVVQAWNDRPLDDTAHPFVLVDALVIKVREDDRVVSKSALVATGVRADGYRTILGLRLGDSESEASWTDFFTWLQARGLREVDLVVSDDHRGLVAAIQRQFQGVRWQRCQTHFTRNLRASTPKPLQDELITRVQTLFQAPDRSTARLLLQQIITDYGHTASATVQKLEDAFEDVTAVLALPASYRKRLRTTNPQERLNEEIRRRERVIRIFPNAASAVRLIGAYLMEYDEFWTTAKRYFDMTAYWEWKQAQTPQLTFLATPSA